MGCSLNRGKSQKRFFSTISVVNLFNQEFTILRKVIIYLKSLKWATIVSLK